MRGAWDLDPDLQGAVVALGNFDGVHLGHRKVVEKAVAMARDAGAPVLAATFDPHPVRFFRPDAEPFLLSGLERRKQLLRLSGADEAVALPFDRAMAELTPMEFVRTWLRDRLRASVVVTGEDFNFGRDRRGSVEDLRSLCAEEGISSAAVSIVRTAADAVSSTAIRTALRQGSISRAALLLGRPVEIEGRARWTTGGAELDLGDRLRPKSGTYDVLVHVRDCEAKMAGLVVPETREHPLLLLDRASSRWPRALAMADGEVVVQFLRFAHAVQTATRCSSWILDEGGKVASRHQA